MQNEHATLRRLTNMIEGLTERQKIATLATRLFSNLTDQRRCFHRFFRKHHPGVAAVATASHFLVASHSYGSHRTKTVHLVDDRGDSHRPTFSETLPCSALSYSGSGLNNRSRRDGTSPTNIFTDEQYNKRKGATLFRAAPLLRSKALLVETRPLGFYRPLPRVAARDK
jgi:hypothetical protein